MTMHLSNMKHLHLFVWFSALLPIVQLDTTPFMCIQIYSHKTWYNYITHKHLNHHNIAEMFFGCFVSDGESDIYGSSSYVINRARVLHCDRRHHCLCLFLLLLITFLQNTSLHHSVFARARGSLGPTAGKIIIGWYALKIIDNWFLTF